MWALEYRSIRTLMAPSHMCTMIGGYRASDLRPEAAATGPLGESLEIANVDNTRILVIS
jgi:hypothetical protein